MRLLNVKSYCLEEFFEPSIPAYAILSHRWEGDEVTSTDIQGKKYKHRHAFRKVQYACTQAAKDDLDFIWIDTCCIDKSSSAELSEAINSMFRWYQNADVCYAYLSDIKTGSSSLAERTESFEDSVWFKRGWTLQELIVPMTVKFYDCRWSNIGSRIELADRISKVTRIPKGLLGRSIGFVRNHLETFTIAQRFSWAAHRQTTRIEDRAYALLGLFNVNMPLLYGEGERAFVRLQEEILKVGTDLSILAWGHGGRRDLLATRPEDFRDCNGIVRLFPMGQPLTREMTLTMTNIGLRIENPLLTEASNGAQRRGLALSLACRSGKDITKIIALKLRPIETSNSHLTAQARSTLCHIGWDHNETTGEGGRLVFVDIFDPARSLPWPVVTIPRQQLYFDSNPHKVRRSTHLWLRLPESEPSLHWRVMKVHPEMFWNSTNLTMNLSDLTRNLYSPLHGAAYVDIALCDDIGTQISIHFSRKPGWLTGSGDDIQFRIAQYNATTFPGPASDLEREADAYTYSFQLPGNRKIVARLDRLRGEDFVIAQLTLSIESSMTLGQLDHDVGEDPGTLGLTEDLFLLNSPRSSLSSRS